MSFLSKLPYIIATILLLIGGALFFAFPIRNIFEYYIRYEPNRIYLIIPVLAGSYLIPMYLFVMSTFFLASFVDPGIYPRESTKEEDDFRQPLYRGAVVNGVSVRMKWCETCNFYRPPRTSHCSICDNCVENFDHHCPWVDNCIGKRNYKYFFMFVNSLSFFILNGFGWTAFSIILHSQNRQLIHATLDFILIGVGVIGFIPVVGLAGFHCGLVCMGRTTNEHVTGKYRSTGNPFDMGCKRNCTAVLCAPKTPRYANYIAKSYRPHRLPHSGRSTISPPTIPVYEEVDSARRAAEEEMCNTNNIAAIPLNVLSSNGASARDPLQANIIHSPPPDELQYADALMREFTV